MRKPQPFFRKFTGTWYVQIERQQINLGPNEEAAWNRYHAIMAGQVTGDNSTTVAVVFDHFLDWCQRNRALASYEFYKRFLDSFAQRIGRRLRVDQLKPYHVTQWTADRYSASSPMTVHHAIRSVQRAMNWAVREGYFDSSSVARIQKPTRTRRQLALTPEQWHAVYNTASDGPFRDLLTILHETGCRPQEARIIEARHFERKYKRWVLPRELSKGGRACRVIYLNPTAIALTEKLAAQYPEGDSQSVHPRRVRSSISRQEAN